MNVKANKKGEAILMIKSYNLSNQERPKSSVISFHKYY